MPTIENQELVTEIFGEWPSFHDAEVVSLRLDRQGEGGGEDGPTLDAAIHVWRTTEEVDPRGY